MTMLLASQIMYSAMLGKADTAKQMVDLLNTYHIDPAKLKNGLGESVFEFVEGKWDWGVTPSHEVSELIFEAIFVAKLERKWN